MNGTPDRQHLAVDWRLNEVEHRYGSHIHILRDPLVTTYLARLSSPRTIQPEINSLVRLLYHFLMVSVANNEFPRLRRSVETRMITTCEHGIFTGEVIDPRTPVVVASMARAGMLPGQVCFDALTDLLDGNVVRHDYFGVGRTVDQQQHVTGASVTYSRVGGPFADAILLIPDPMGATGGSVVETVRTYEQQVDDKPRKTIAMHLIITPEYVRRITAELPGVIVYAARLDRGMSDDEVLQSVPGTFPDRERGLNDKQYIVPGAGGLGEIMTNAFV